MTPINLHHIAKAVELLEARGIVPDIVQLTAGDNQRIATYEGGYGLIGGFVFGMRVIAGDTSRVGGYGLDRQKRARLKIYGRTWIKL